MPVRLAYDIGLFKVILEAQRVFDLSDVESLSHIEWKAFFSCGVSPNIYDFLRQTMLLNQEISSCSRVEKSTKYDRRLR